MKFNSTDSQTAYDIDETGQPTERKTTKKQNLLITLVGTEIRTKLEAEKISRRQ